MVYRIYFTQTNIVKIENSSIKYVTFKAELESQKHYSTKIYSLKFY